MNAAELPMILFTVIAQMCVGMFIVLGLIQVLGTLRYSHDAVDRVSDPALFAIGPALVLGLAASTLHMHDPLNVLNVFRHFGSSWLSREIVFGMLFAGLGFAFALLQWRKLGPVALRRVVAVLTALAGVALVVSMTNVYLSLTAVPAWHTWATPLQFWATTLLLGSLGVGAALMVTHLRRRASASGSNEEAVKLMGDSLKGIAVLAMLAGGAILVGMPLHIASLASQGGVAAESAHVFTGWVFGVRLGLVVLGACLMGLFTYFLAGSGRRRVGPLASVVLGSFALVLVGELLGRALFYESMLRVGM